MTLRELIDGLGIKAVCRDGDDSLRICDITDDSRTALPGSLFIARQGQAADGRTFIHDALNHGAVAVLTDDANAVPENQRLATAVLLADDLAGVAATVAERFYGEPSRALKLVGVTGTNGKTTVAHLIHHLLNDAGKRCGLMGTVSVDDGQEFSDAELTTPPALEISRTLAQMCESGCAAACLEVSSHAIDQGRSAALDFDIGIFTNLSGDHLDYHGSMEAYAAAKAKLFAQLKPQAMAIVNIDDAHAEQMIAACPCPVLRCTARGTEGADANARLGTATMSATSVMLHGPWGDIEADVLLVGAHNAANILQAVAAGHLLGLTAHDLQEGLRTAISPPGRLEAVTAAEAPFAVLVDYAHTDDALRNVLQATRPLLPESGRLCVVFGCGGDRDRSKRPRMAEVACELADHVFVTSDNPRSESPDRIVDEVMCGVPYERRQQVSRVVDRSRAIAAAMQFAGEGDMVIVAGKGHEDYQIVADGKGGTVKIPFDDRRHARSALEAIGVPTAPLRPPPTVRMSEDDAAQTVEAWDEALSLLEKSEL